MPGIDEFKCDKCDLALPHGWGGYTYVQDENGKRIICPHPCESRTIAEVLGLNQDNDEENIRMFPWLPIQNPETSKLVRERTGFNSYCICLNCLNQFELDIRKDERTCPECNLLIVKSALELVGEVCPKCKDGVFKKIKTGIIS